MAFYGCLIINSWCAYIFLLILLLFPYLSFFFFTNLRIFFLLCVSVFSSESVFFYFLGKHKILAHIVYEGRIRFEVDKVFFSLWLDESWKLKIEICWGQRVDQLEMASWNPFDRSMHKNVKFWNLYLNKNFL